MAKKHNASFQGGTLHGSKKERLLALECGEDGRPTQMLVGGHKVPLSVSTPLEKGTVGLGRTGRIRLRVD